MSIMMLTNLFWVWVWVVWVP